VQAQSLACHLKLQGALPILEHFLLKLQLSQLLSQHIAHPNSVAALNLLVKSVLLQPSALYRIAAWAQHYDPVWLPSVQHWNDDLLGRALDRLFHADRASLLTALVLQAVKAFAIQTQQIHNDSTSVKLSGAYLHQKPNALQLRQGFSKDHRPDLKQLVYCLSISADGAVPVHFKAYPGNQVDNPTHWESWQCLCQILGHNDFLYVADCKLCTQNVLQQIHQQNGRFITVLPRNLTEVATFAQSAAAGKVQWTPLWRRRACRSRQRRETFELASGNYTLAERYPIYWYRCSEKQPQDAAHRQSRITNVCKRLERLNERRGRGPKTEPAIRRAAQNLLTHYRAQSWVEFDIQLRPPAGQLKAKPVPVLSTRLNQAAIMQSQAMDGTFPLVTNTQLSPLEVLQKYKYQPHLEKRHCLNKSVLEISPVFLKSNLRIEALMFVYFIAELVAALIERTLRHNMARRSLKTIPSLPEARDSASPTYIQVLDAFAFQSKHELYEKDLQTHFFVTPLSELQKTMLQLLEIDPAIYN